MLCACNSGVYDRAQRIEKAIKEEEKKIGKRRDVEICRRGEEDENYRNELDYILYLPIHFFKILTFQKEKKTLE